MEYCYHVTLTKMEVVGVTVEPVDREVRLFSSKESAERWLADNDFVYGQRRFLNYPAGYREWFHRDDIAMDRINVTITKIYLDDITEPKIKHRNIKYI